MKSSSPTKELDYLAQDIEYLQKKLERDNMDLSCVAEIQNDMNKKKEKYIQKVHKNKIQEVHSTRGDGSCYTIFRSRVNGETKYTTASTYDGLIDKLYEAYAIPTTKNTLLSIYEAATIWKRDKKAKKVTGKTLYEYNRIWENRIKNNIIAECPLDQITPQRLTEYFDEVIQKYGLTFTQTQDIRNVLSYLFKYAINKGMMKHNVLLDVDFGDMDYVVSSKKRNKVNKTPFPVSKIAEAKAYCETVLAKPNRVKIYPFAFMLGLAIGDRAGELNALSWADIDFDNQTIKTGDQAIAQYEMKDDLTFEYKGRKKAGYIKGHNEIKAVPAPKEAFVMLKRLKELNLSDEDVFPDFRYNTFNAFVKEVAGAIGLNASDYSTHSLRATKATEVYLDTHNVELVRSVLHHTTTAMSQRYIIDVEEDQKLRDYYESKN